MDLEGRVGVRMSTEVMDTFPSFHRLTLNKTMLLVRAAKGFMSKSAGRGSEAGSEGDSESMDYLPLVSSSSLGLVGVVWLLRGNRGGSPKSSSCSEKWRAVAYIPFS